MNREQNPNSGKSTSSLDKTSKLNRVESTDAVELSDDQIASISGGVVVDAFPPKGAGSDTSITPDPTNPPTFP